jgi:1-phosphatidylinositol-3-phosphate 5-kinase
VNIKSAVSKNGEPEAVYILLNLNRLLWELLLESCIWGRRFHSLLSPDRTAGDSNTAERVMQEQVKSNMDGPATGGNEGIETILESGHVDTSTEDELPIKEIPVEGQVQEFSEGSDVFNASTFAEGEMPTVGISTNRSSDQECAERQNGSAHCRSGDDKSQAVIPPLFDHPQVDRTIPVSTGLGNTDSISDLRGSKKDKSLHSLSSLQNSIGWFWTPFSEIRQIDMKDLLKGYLQKFEAISSYTPEYIPTAYQLITEEGSRLHIPLESDNYIVSDHEGELSSIIACALSTLKDLPVPSEVLDENSKRETGMAAKSFESLHSLVRISTIWSSTGSTESDSVHSTNSSEDSRFSSFDGLNLLDSFVPPDPFNPVVNLLGKGKYSVACLYANEFRDLRSRCCPSEVDYIASLSRCRNWDAKGGKSKSLFAKTLDDRFIIKEIKKTEFDSFMKFARDYFKYMTQSFELGNQTCLAKVLGIYQVCWIDFTF